MSIVGRFLGVPDRGKRPQKPESLEEVSQRVESFFITGPKGLARMVEEMILGDVPPEERESRVIQLGFNPEGLKQQANDLKMEWDALRTRARRLTPEGTTTLEELAKDKKKAFLDGFLSTEPEGEEKKFDPLRVGLSKMMYDRMGRLFLALSASTLGEWGWEILNPREPLPSILNARPDSLSEFTTAFQRAERSYKGKCGLVLPLIPDKTYVLRVEHLLKRGIDPLIEQKVVPNKLRDQYRFAARLLYQLITGESLSEQEYQQLQQIGTAEEKIAGGGEVSSKTQRERIAFQQEITLEAIDPQSLPDLLRVNPDNPSPLAHLFDAIYQIYGKVARYEKRKELLSALGVVPNVSFLESEAQLLRDWLRTAQLPPREKQRWGNFILENREGRTVNHTNLTVGLALSIHRCLVALCEALALPQEQRAAVLIANSHTEILESLGYDSLDQIPDDHIGAFIAQLSRPDGKQELRDMVQSALNLTPESPGWKLYNLAICVAGGGTIPVQETM